MGITNVVSMLQVLSYSRQYDAIITNITTANSISGSVKLDIDNEMWKIVAGKVEFSEGKQYQIMENVSDKSKRDDGKYGFEASQEQTDFDPKDAKVPDRNTLIKWGARSPKTAQRLKTKLCWKISVLPASVMEEVVGDYVLYEVQSMEGQYQLMRAGFVRWQIFSIILIFGAVTFSVVAAWSLSRSIYTPIKKLHDVTTTITKNDLQALMTSDNVDEITELGMSFNIMIGKIKELLDSKIKEQENLKKAELRALQAQINPHFLYNTLDTIIWMAESKKTDQVVKIVSALIGFLSY